jgi:hypothetical protein
LPWVFSSGVRPEPYGGFSAWALAEDPYDRLQRYAEVYRPTAHEAEGMVPELERRVRPAGKPVAPEQPG